MVLEHIKKKLLTKSTPKITLPHLAIYATTGNVSIISFHPHNHSASILTMCKYCISKGTTQD